MRDALYASTEVLETFHIGSVRFNTSLEVVEGGVEPLESWVEPTEIFDAQDAFCAFTLNFDSEIRPDLDIPSLEAMKDDENDLTCHTGCNVLDYDLLATKSDLHAVTNLHEDIALSPRAPGTSATEGGNSTNVLSKDSGPNLFYDSGAAKVEMDRRFKSDSDQYSSGPLPLISAEPNSMVELEVDHERGCAQPMASLNINGYNRTNSGCTNWTIDLPEFLFAIKSGREHCMVPDCVQDVHIETVAADADVEHEI
ncbi:hypothetical protein B0H13DRAFT_1888154 [Mycena leptocephala]|nr:hypothetical protein B0H13DRAFT_1888154 [Mycena leptocephala]